jgi:hypothetical protein
MSLGISFQFHKADATGRFVRGWASVAEVNGEPITDSQDDVLTMDELRKAAHKFVCDARVAKAMHKGAAVGEVVESVLVDDEFAKALGVKDSRRGWWIGMVINDESVRKRVRSGELKAFSIGGRGRRTKVA